MIPGATSLLKCLQYYKEILFLYFVADVKKCIQDLESECREKDKIIKELMQQIDEKSSSDDSRDRFLTYFN